MLTVTCYFTPLSGYAYLGHDRLCRIAAEHRAAIAWRPVDIMKVFAESGTTPPAKQSPARLAYRKADMARWAAALGMPLNPAPRHWPVPADVACKMIIAAESLGGDAAAIAGAILRAVWAEDENIADTVTLARIATACGFDADALASRAASPEIAGAASRNTTEAVAAGVFGSPTYAIAGELFWGQDRLDFVSRRLKELS